MDRQFEASLETRGGAVVVAASGEVDLATAPELRDRLDAAIGHGNDRVVVDLRDVTFIDSTGLGMLIRAFNQCKERGVRFSLVIAEARILKVFEITGLTDLFPISTTIEDAVAG